MRKVVRLTESDLVKIVKRVIREGNEDTYDKTDQYGLFELKKIINIPEEFGNLKRRVGSETSIGNIIRMWNEYFLPEFMKITGVDEQGNTLVGLRKNGFVNMDVKTFPVDTILKDLDTIYDRNIEYYELRNYLSRRYYDY